jgi:hypothetical protein
MFLIQTILYSFSESLFLIQKTPTVSASKSTAFLHDINQFLLINVPKAP